LKAKYVGIAYIGLLALTAFASSARAQGAAPPVGSWSGPLDSGATLSITVGRDGSYYLQLPAAAVTGNWTWSPTSVGGILTLHYRNAGFNNRLYYSITYLNSNTIVFSDPYFRVTLHRR
jgi:hypothetical protein